MTLKVQHRFGIDFYVQSGNVLYLVLARSIKKKQQQGGDGSAAVLLLLAAAAAAAFTEPGERLSE